MSDKQNDNIIMLDEPIIIEEKECKITSINLEMLKHNMFKKEESAYIIYTKDRESFEAEYIIYIDYDDNNVYVCIEAEELGLSKQVYDKPIPINIFINYIEDMLNKDFFEVDIIKNAILDMKNEMFNELIKESTLILFDNYIVNCKYGILYGSNTSIFNNISKIGNKLHLYELLINPNTDYKILENVDNMIFPINIFFDNDMMLRFACKIEKLHKNEHNIYYSTINILNSLDKLYLEYIDEANFENIRFNDYGLDTNIIKNANAVTYNNENASEILKEIYKNNIKLLIKKINTNKSLIQNKIKLVKNDLLSLYDNDKIITNYYLMN